MLPLMSMCKGVMLELSVPAGEIFVSRTAVYTADKWLTVINGHAALSGVSVLLAVFWAMLHGTPLRCGSVCLFVSLLHRLCVSVRVCCLALTHPSLCLQCLLMLERARNIGIAPNTIMYNTALSALGKAGKWETAEKLFGEIPEPDAISYETLIAAYGIAGQAGKAETVFRMMQEAQHMPKDYAYTALVAAHR